MIVTENSSRVNDTNVSTSYADSSLVQGKQAAGERVFNNNFDLQTDSVKDVSNLKNFVSVSVLKNDVSVSDNIVCKTDDLIGDDFVSNSDASNVACGDVSNNSDVYVTSTPTAPTHATQLELCTCICGKSNGVNKTTKPEKSSTSFYSKKQTCFNCGTAIHIAHNYENRAFVLFYAQRREN